MLGASARGGVAASPPLPTVARGRSDARKGGRANVTSRGEAVEAGQACQCWQVRRPLPGPAWQCDERGGRGRVAALRSPAHTQAHSQCPRKAYTGPITVFQHGRPGRSGQQNVISGRILPTWSQNADYPIIRVVASLRTTRCARCAGTRRPAPPGPAPPGVTPAIRAGPRGRGDSDSDPLPCWLACSLPMRAGGSGRQRHSKHC